MNLSNSTVMITGGGNGIGAYLAGNLYSQASKIIVIDIDGDKLHQLGQDFPEILTYQCDLTNVVELENVMGKIYEESLQIDILINNAGIIYSAPLINLLDRAAPRHSFTDWNKVVDINLNAVFYMTSLVVEKMQAQRVKGLIINMSSISATGNKGQSAYSATKAAIEALTVTWSKELGMFKIRCAGIAPGFFDTPSTNAALSEKYIKMYTKAIPVGRLGKLKEILDAVQFIIKNDYFNGRILRLDGGMRI